MGITTNSVITVFYQCYVVVSVCKVGSGLSTISLSYYSLRYVLTYLLTYLPMNSSRSNFFRKPDFWAARFSAGLPLTVVGCTLNSSTSSPTAWFMFIFLSMFAFEARVRPQFSTSSWHFFCSFCSDDGFMGRHMEVNMVDANDRSQDLS